MQRKVNSANAKWSRIAADVINSNAAIVTTITMLMIIIILQLQLQLQLHFKETALCKAWGKTCSNWMTSLMNTSNKTYINMQIAGKYVNTYVHIYTHTCVHTYKNTKRLACVRIGRALAKKRATTTVKRTKLSPSLLSTLSHANVRSLPALVLFASSWQHCSPLLLCECVLFAA